MDALSLNKPFEEYTDAEKEALANDPRIKELQALC